MRNMKAFGLTALGLLVLWVPLFGHHGTAVSYDQKQLVKVKGVVKEFNWRNPHSSLFIEGKDASGNAVTYSLEMGSPATLAKQGYTRTIFKPGDEVEIEMHPSFANPTSGEAQSRRFIVNGKEVRAVQGGDEGN